MYIVVVYQFFFFLLYIYNITHRTSSPPAPPGATPPCPNRAVSGPPPAESAKLRNWQSSKTGFDFLRCSPNVPPFRHTSATNPVYTQEYARFATSRAHIPHDASRGQWLLKPSWTRVYGRLQRNEAGETPEEDAMR